MVNSNSDYLRGMGVALVTPFQEDGEIDWTALDRLLDYVIGEGTDFLVALGTTGEASMLSDQEKGDVIRFVIQRNQGRLPIVVGMSGNHTASLSRQLSEFDVDGVDFILSVTPYYVRPNQEGLFQHYKEIAGASRKPLILYNVPSRTGVNLEASTSLRIAREVPNVAGIKDATVNLQQFHELLSGRPPGFAVLSGDDATALPAILQGADGVISVIGQALPGDYWNMIHAGLKGDPKEAYRLFRRMNALFGAIFEEGNPAGIKALLSHAGITGPAVRLPLVAASEKLSARLDKLWRDYQAASDL